MVALLAMSIFRNFERGGKSGRPVIENNNRSGWRITPAVRPEFIEGRDRESATETIQPNLGVISQEAIGEK